MKKQKKPAKSKNKTRKKNIKIKSKTTKQKQTKQPQTKNRDIVEDLLIIKSISRDLKKISDAYNIEKKVQDSPETNKKQSFLDASKTQRVFNEKQRLEQQKRAIYKLTYLIYKLSNKVLGEIK